MMKLDLHIMPNAVTQTQSLPNMNFCY